MPHLAIWQLKKWGFRSGLIYQFALYDYPLKEKERDEVLRSHQFILYNDSVVFESYGDYCDLRGFPDKDKFQPLNEVNK